MAKHLTTPARILAGLTLGTVLVGPAAMSATINFAVNDSLTPGNAGGSASVSITDIGTNEVQVTLTPNLSASGPQTITGLWLNAPTGLAGMTISTVSPSPNNPYVASSLSYTSTQTQLAGPFGADFDLMLKFVNNGSSNAIQSTSPPEIFDLTSTGGTLTAQSFALTDSPTGANKPANEYAQIGITNYTGVAGSGVGYIAATSISPVPLPAALPLMLSSLGGLGLLVGRRRNRSVKA